MPRRIPRMPVEEAVVAALPVLAELAVVALARAVAGHPERQTQVAVVVARVHPVLQPEAVVLAS